MLGQARMGLPFFGVYSKGSDAFPRVNLASSRAIQRQIQTQQQRQGAAEAGPYRTKSHGQQMKAGYFLGVAGLAENVRK